MTKSIKFFLNIVILIISFISFYAAIITIIFLTKNFYSFKDIMFDKGLLMVILVFTPAALGLSHFFSNFIKQKVLNSVDSLLKFLIDVNRIEDIEKYEIKKINLYFREYNYILPELKKFLERIKKIAIDKKDLEKIVNFYKGFVLNTINIKDENRAIQSFVNYFSSMVRFEAVFYYFSYEKDLKFYILNDSSFYETNRSSIEEYINNLSTSQVSLTEKQLKIENSKKFIYFKMNYDIPVFGSCLVGFIVNERINSEYKTHVLESIINLMINLVVSLKIINKSVKEIEYFAVKDPLTGVFTKNAFIELFENKIFFEAHNKKFCLLLVDIDNFKFVNFTYGHNIGDYVLEKMPQMINSFFPAAIIGRYSGDKFAVLLENYVEDNSIYETANKMRDYFARFIFELNNLNVTGLTLSVSIAYYPDNANTVRDLLIFADTMLLKAKSKTKNVITYNKDQHVQIFKSNSDFSLNVAEAVKNRSFQLFFQPIVDLAQKEVFGYEILTKIIINGMLISADKFLPLINKLGLTYDFDIAVLDCAFKKVKELNFKEFMFINLHASTIQNTNFLNCLVSLSEIYVINPESIVLEIIERDTVENIDYFSDVCKLITKSNFKIAIDDFGSGFSSFSFLKVIPAEFVKLEGDFVKNMKFSNKDRLIIDAIVDVCKKSNIKIIAEYIEDIETLNEAMNKQIDFGQGFYLGKPEIEMSKFCIPRYFLQESYD